MENKVDIPEELQQICKDLAKVARQHGLHKLSGKFSPHNGWSGDISFSWELGRHGEDSNQISISSSFFIHTQINE